MFVPMPIGTGNDLSRSLNFGKKLALSFLDDYFKSLNSSNQKIVEYD